MSKQISPVELAQIVNKLLTDKYTIDTQLDSAEKFSQFMSAIAGAVCESCGGEIRYPADDFSGEWYIGIHGNDSIPEDGGIWSAYDPDGCFGLQDTAKQSKAYEITEEDVENVLRSNWASGGNTNGKTLSSIASEIFPQLDYEKIEDAALFGDNLDEQTDYANDEIARQLREMGVLEFERMSDASTDDIVDGSGPGQSS